MIPPDNYIIFLKFSEQRWIDSLVNGNFSFSCVGKFIQQAQATGDTVQGDSFKGYFARLKKMINVYYNAFQIKGRFGGK